MWRAASIVCGALFSGLLSGSTAADLIVTDTIQVTLPDGTTELRPFVSQRDPTCQTATDTNGTFFSPDRLSCGRAGPFEFMSVGILAPTPLSLAGRNIVTDILLIGDTQVGLLGLTNGALSAVNGAVGVQGPGTANIGSGGTLNVGLLTIGADALGELFLTADAALNSSEITVGHRGVAELTALSTAQIVANEVTIADFTPSAFVNMSGNAAISAAELTLGVFSGSSGELNLSEAARGNFQEVTLGEDPNATGKISVTGRARLDASIVTTIGEEGDGMFEVENGGHATTEFLLIGESISSHGVLTVEDANFDVSNSAVIGGEGLGDLFVSQGGSFSSQDDVLIGGRSGGAGSTATVIGSGSSLATATEFMIGGGEVVVPVDGGTILTGSGTGSLVVKQGATARATEDAWIGVKPGSDGYVRVEGDGSLFQAGSFIGIGLDRDLTFSRPGGDGVLEIADKGKVLADEILVGESGRIVGDGDPDDEGTVNIEAIFLKNGGTIAPGAQTGGAGPATGTLNIAGQLEHGITEAATLEIEIADTDDFDRINVMSTSFVAGTFDLNGQVDVSLIGGFEPTIRPLLGGDQFDIVVADSVELVSKDLINVNNPDSLINLPEIGDERYLSTGIVSTDAGNREALRVRTVEQKIFLNYSDAISTDFEIFWNPLKNNGLGGFDTRVVPGTYDPLGPLDPSLSGSITEGVRDIFLESGINIQILDSLTSTRPVDALEVRFGPQIKNVVDINGDGLPDVEVTNDELGGIAWKVAPVGGIPDRFNAVLGGEVAIFVDEDNVGTGVFSASGLARTVSHEVGHGLGLRHVAGDVMRPESGPAGTRFVDSQLPFEDFGPTGARLPGDHNPIYHLQRFSLLDDDVDLLVNQEIEAGTWDLGFYQISSFGLTGIDLPGSGISNLVVQIPSGLTNQEEASSNIAFFETVDPAAPTEVEFLFSTDFPFQMLASSLDGSFMDLFFGFGDEFNPILTFEDLVPGEITGSIFQFLPDSGTLRSAGTFAAALQLASVVSPEGIRDAAVPEPPTIILFLVGLSGLIVLARRQRPIGWKID